MGGLSTLGLSWEQIKQKLESEGAKNKAYDIDNNGLVENIAFKSVAELPATPKDYEIVHYQDAVRFYDPNKGKWASLLYLFGYDRFDNNGRGVWTKYINIPITTTPSEYAQYKVVIDSNNVTVYSADGTQKAQGAVASDFWANVKSDGSDIRIFDQAKEQLYFWIEEFDYSNKKAVIWVNLTAGSSELNIAYSNPSATKSDYEDASQVFELFDDFEGDSLDTTKWQIAKDTVTVSNGIAVFSGHGGSIRSLQTFDNAIIETKIKITSTEQYDHGIIAYRGDENLDIGSGTEAGNGYTVWVQSNYYDQSLRLKKFVNGSITDIEPGTSKVDTTQWHTVRVAFSGDKHKVWLDDNLEIDATDTEFASGYIQIGNRTEGETHVDWVRVLKLADPADFGTPQILEF